MLMLAYLYVFVTYASMQNKIIITTPQYISKLSFHLLIYKLNQKFIS